MRVAPEKWICLLISAALIGCAPASQPPVAPANDVSGRPMPAVPKDSKLEPQAGEEWFVPEGNMATTLAAADHLAALEKADNANGISELRRDGQVTSLISATIKVIQKLPDGQIEVQIIKSDSKFAQVSIGQKGFVHPDNLPTMRRVP